MFINIDNIIRYS